jgi:hypothetical protein
LISSLAVRLGCEIVDKGGCWADTGSVNGEGTASETVSAKVDWPGAAEGFSEGVDRAALGRARRRKQQTTRIARANTGLSKGLM